MKVPIAVIALAALALACWAVTGAEERLPPWELAQEGWRTDAAWYDGKAEKAVYDAKRRIYGLEREYVATAYTNKQHMDPATTTKSANDAGVEVFKHHWSERVPTENYDYDFSTCTFTRTGDLGAFKLTVATQEDCGASFKQLWREGDRLRWLESVYFPDAGLREGELDGPVHFADALPLLLRDYPFDAPLEPVSLRLVPSQKSTRKRSFEPAETVVRYVGRQTLTLPAGEVEAHHLAAVGVADLWFAADGTAPWLHALVRYQDADAVYELRSLERTAYWER